MTDGIDQLFELMSIGWTATGARIQGHGQVDYSSRQFTSSLIR